MRGERRAQAGVIQHVRMQLEDLAAEPLDGDRERGVGAAVGVLVVAAMMVAQLLASHQEVLDRLVVQQLGQPLALALLRGQRLRDQPSALVGGRPDPAVALAEQRRQHHRPRPRPRQEQRVRDDRVDVGARAGRRMRQREQDVDGDRRPRPAAVSAGRSRKAATSGSAKNASRASE